MAPFGFLVENQQPAGLDIDVANLIANDLGVELELLPMTAQNRLPNLVTDKVDILVALLSLTTERAKQIMFTSPYTSTTIGVFGPADAAVTGPEGIGSLSVGVSRGTVEDTAITNLSEFFQRFQRLNIRSNEQLDELVEQAQGIIRGVQPQQLRENLDLREQVAEQLGSVQSALDDLLVDRPRRNILRKPR